MGDGAMTRVRAWLEAGLPWGILALMAGGFLGGDVSEGVQRLVVQNGGVLLLVALMLQYAPRAIEAQRDQARALQDLAASIREQGGLHERALDELRHGQEVIMDRLGHIKARLEERL